MSAPDRLVLFQVAEALGQDPFELEERWTVEQLTEALEYLRWRGEQEAAAIKEAKNRR